MSFSLHSSTENLGGGRRSGSVGSNSSSRLSCPVKSSWGRMSRNVSARPRSRNHWNESRWMATRSGRGRASSMFAKEKRSGLLDRGDNGLLLPVAGQCDEGTAGATGAAVLARTAGRHSPSERAGGGRFAEPDHGSTASAEVVVQECLRARKSARKTD